MKMMDRKRWLGAGLALVLALATGIPCAQAKDESKWVGVWQTNAGTAKKYALENNRPILAVFNHSTTCTYCETFRSKVLSTTAFMDFAKASKLVLFRTSETGTFTRISSAFGSKGANLSDPPIIAIFKVLDTADTTLTDYRAWTRATEVDIPQVNLDTTEAKYCIRGYGRTIFGVDVSNANNWNPADFKTILQKKFFPNNYWSTLSPDGSIIDDEDSGNTTGGSTTGGSTTGGSTTGGSTTGGSTTGGSTTGGSTTGGSTIDTSNLSDKYVDEAKWLGVWQTDAGLAKKYALQNNRPILAVFNHSTTCTYCETFRSKVLSTTAFMDFARANKLVLFRTSETGTFTRISSTFGSKGANLSDPPIIAIFKVKDGADFTLTDYKAWTREAEVDVPQVTLNTSEAKYCIRGYGKTIFGVDVSNANNWNPADFITILQSKFFPNNYWTTITPASSPRASGSETGGSTTGGGDSGNTTGGGTTGGNDSGNTTGGSTTGGSDSGNTTGGGTTGGSTIDTSNLPDKYVDEAKWLGVWQTDAGLAKKYALQNNRPILAVFNHSTTCTYCETFRSKVLSTTAFMDFARANKLVLFRTSETGTFTRISSTFGSKGANLSDPPIIAIFKVKDGADFTLTDYKAWTREAEVDVPQVTLNTSEAKYCIRGYGKTIFGVDVSNANNWNPADFITILKSKFFPNNYWTTITPASSPRASGSETGGGDSGNTTGGGDSGNTTGGGDSGNTTGGGDSGNTTGGSTVTYQNEDKWVGIWQTDASVAKKYALQNNRPIFAVFNHSTTCTYCETFRSKVLSTTAFLDYVKANKLVLFRTSDTGTFTRISSAFGSKGANLSDPPIIAIFKVLETADLTLTDYRAWTRATEVDIPQVTMTTSEPLYCIRGYTKTIFGVDVSNASNWNPTDFKTILGSRFFPNNYWSTIEPQAEGPTGYENAIDMLNATKGTEINGEFNPPALGGSGLMSASATLDASTKSVWFRFVGNAGKRYWFYAAPTTVKANFKYSVEIYETSGDKPQAKPRLSFTRDNFEAFGNGFWMDATAGTARKTPFYVHVSVSGGAQNAADSFRLCVHETIASPASGTVTNPAWKTSVKGSWTADMNAAMTAAYKAGKPVLAYFAGLGWCPYCCGFEINVLEKAAFQTQTAEYFNVVLDFRKRDDSGPSLFIYENTYLKDAGATLAQGQAKLAANRIIQETYATPGFNKTGWEKGAIGYPTLLYCRVLKTGTSTYSLQPVGRFDSDIGDADAAVAQLKRLDALYAAGYAESSEQADSTTVSLPLAQNAAAKFFGGTNLGPQWMKFTVANGKSWCFTAQASSAADNALVTFTVYAADDPNKPLSSGTGSLKDGAVFAYLGDNGNYLLKIQVDGQDDIATGTLSYEQRLLQAQISLAEPEIGLARDENISCDIALEHTALTNGNAVETFEYRITTDDDKVPSWLSNACDWTVKTWNDGCTIPVSLAIPAAEKAWTGTKDLYVEIRDHANGNCLVAGTTRTCVRLCAAPCFVPEPPVKDFVRYVGSQVIINFPVCYTTGVNIVTKNITLPDGLTLVDNTADADDPRVTITGTPTKVTTRMENTIALSPKYLDEPHELTFGITIRTLPADLAAAPGFAAMLDLEGTTGEHNGLLTLTKLASGGFQASVSTRESQQPQTADAGGWAPSDSQDGTLCLTAEFDDGATLDVQMSEDLIGTAEYVSANGNHYLGTLYVQTSKPADYQGVYNVAIRDVNDTEGLTEGWLNINVDSKGNAAETVCVYDSDVRGNVTTCVLADGRLFFYQPLYWYDTAQTYIGQVYGILSIIPKSQRSTEYVSDTWISACNSDDCRLFASDGSQTALTLCGTIFLADKTIAYCTGVNELYFVAEQPAGTLVPSWVKLTEKTKFKLQSANATPLAGELGPLTVNSADGTFSGTLNILKRGAADANGLSTLTRQAVTVSGLMVPTTQQCCSISENIAVGYGAFIYQDAIYRVCIFTDTFGQLTAPEITTVDWGTDTQGQDWVELACTAAPIAALPNLTNGLLFKDATTGDLRLATWKGATTTVRLPAGHVWKASSIAMDSELAQLSGAPASESTATATSAEFQTVSYTLAAGWNLLGIPRTLASPRPSTACTFIGYDRKRQAYVQTTVPQAGQGYWLYASEAGTLTVTGLKITAADTVVPAGWSLQAFPGKLTGVEMWQFKDGALQLIQSTAADEKLGVWMKR